METRPARLASGESAEATFGRPPVPAVRTFGATDWDRVLAAAAASPRDAALLSGLAFRSGGDATVTLAARVGDAGIGFLRGNVDLVRSAIERLAGRPVEVQVEFEGTEERRAPSASRATIAAEVREHPVVQLAADLFDAAVVEVVPLRHEKADPLDRGVSTGVRSTGSDPHEAVETE